MIFMFTHKKNKLILDYGFQASLIKKTLIV